MTPGMSRTQASSTTKAAVSPPDRTKSPIETSSRPRAAISRSSTPSKRPHRMTAPSPLASWATRACVSGAPRALIKRRGRGSGGMLLSARLSRALASTSAFITMPGPPPAGVSSTVPCLSSACARMSIASSDHSPAFSAFPARLMPSGPGNISGNMVRTDARHMATSPRSSSRKRGSRSQENRSRVLRTEFPPARE